MVFKVIYDLRGWINTGVEPRTAAFKFKLSIIPSYNVNLIERHVMGLRELNPRQLHKQLHHQPQSSQLRSIEGVCVCGQVNAGDINLYW